MYKRLKCCCLRLREIKKEESFGQLGKYEFRLKRLLKKSTPILLHQTSCLNLFWGVLRSVFDFVVTNRSKKATHHHHKKLKNFSKPVQVFFVPPLFLPKKHRSSRSSSLQFYETLLSSFQLWEMKFHTTRHFYVFMMKTVHFYTTLTTKAGGQIGCFPMPPIFENYKTMCFINKLTIKGCNSCSG